MIDTHAHLNFSDFEKDYEEVLGNSLKQLEAILIASSDVSSSEKSVVLSRGDDRLFASVGVHPHEIDGTGEFQRIIELSKDPKVKAIGETGLDYFYLKGNIQEAKKLQRELLEKHLGLAEKVSKPLIFHVREAEDDFLEVVRKFQVKGVVHCFTGDWTFAKEVLELGYYISFTGIITFLKTERILEVVEKVPMDKIMVETDCPYLAPVPYRGKRSEPWMVLEVVKKIAEVRKMTVSEVDKKTTLNAKAFFGL